MAASPSEKCISNLAKNFIYNFFKRLTELRMTLKNLTVFLLRFN